jgi:ABC-2 type transport system ATP-binding protein
MTQDYAVEASNVKRRYKAARGASYEAVKGVDLTVRRGELFALLGTNGSGKTSIMEMLEGHVRPDEGICTVLGLDPYEQRPAVRRRTGIVLQDGSLQGDLTVEETMRMWSCTLSTPRPSEEVLKLVDLTDRGKVPVNRLSGGERRRLDFAIAILGEPEVLFLDEPTAGLDPESRARIQLLIRSLLDAGSTVVLTTHYLQEAEDLADQLAILHEGTVKFAGTRADILASALAHVTFSLPVGAPGRLPILSKPVNCQVRYLHDGRRRVRVQTRETQATLNTLLTWAKENHLTLDDVEARPASLEEVFLAIAGSKSEGREHTEQPS